MRLVDFLSHLWPEVDRTALRQLVFEGRVEINTDETAVPRRRVKAGDFVQVRLPVPADEMKRYETRAAAPQDLSVLHEDDAILVVHKPAGVGAGRDKTGRHPGVLDLLIAEREDPDLRLLFRSDRGSSGCLVIAKSLAVAQVLEAALANGSVLSEHLALALGSVRDGDQVVDRPLGPDRRRPGRILVVEPESKGARPAVTRITVETRFRDHTLVRVRPMTWRNHQIRAHLGWLGHPIVADADYGPRPHLLLSEIKKHYKTRAGVVERPLLERMFLHLERVRLPDLGGDAAGFVTIDAPLPKDLTVVLAKLRTFAAV